MLMILEEITSDLNQEQQQAVIHGDGPFLIIAGAGTGKTTVITRRIAWLILSGKAKPEEILALTFTDKAAEEMEERIDKLLPYGYVDLWASTFHSFCERILRQHAIEIGLPLNFKIINSAQQALLVRQNFSRFNLNYYRPLGTPFKFIQDLIKHFSRAKDEFITPEEYLNYAEKIALDQDTVTSHKLLDQEAGRLKEIAEAYQTYQQLLLENSALDFGDLINYTIKLFKDRPNVLAKYREQFKYVLVDEFQDTNWSQYELLKLLGAPKNNLTVVADDDQSIYKFRGASYNNVIQFKRDYPKTKEVVLVKNYRSRQEILDMAYRFIQLNNPNRLEAQVSQLDGVGDLPKNVICKKLEATRGNGANIDLLQSATQDEEAKAVVDKIIEMKEKNPEASWNDFAILVRANNQAEIFCQALRWRNVPYQFLAHSGLFSKPIILDILAYLKLLVNYHESTALYRILTSPIFSAQGLPSGQAGRSQPKADEPRVHASGGKITNEDLVNIINAARRKGKSLYQTLKTIHSLQEISKDGASAIDQLLGWIEKHSQMARQQGAGKIVYSFLEDSGYLKSISRQAEKGGLENIENVAWVSQFFKKIEEFELTNTDKSLKNFIETIDIIIEAGDEGSLPTDIIEVGPETVKIMTVHGAKGLEFKTVFLVNLVDRRFPTSERKEGVELPDALTREIIPEGDIHLQEERRLFYVALTRAKDNLFLTLADDYGGARKKKASRFLYELGLIKEEAIGKKTKVLKLPIFKEEEKKVITQFNLPAKISFSQLRAFENCPLQYKFGFILRIPVRGRYVFSFGQTMHLTLQKFLSQVLLQKKVVQSKLFETPKKEEPVVPNQDLIMKIYDECWIDEWYPDDKLREEYRQKGEKSLKKFYQEFSTSKPDVQYVELDFNFKVGDCTIKGKIDRVDDLGDGLEIIDYKTGTVKDGKLSAEDKEQLLIYQLAAAGLFKKEIKKLTYIFLEDNSQLSFLGTEGELDDMKQKIAKIFDEIHHSNFPAKPSMLCKYCDFKDICEYRKI
ncbi:MAG: UvrD-helicase domain-containing protein [Patescibacteria group bacterium]|nr:UvrD-helicase domain-containing protein [Patescibacteria group bacterium]MDD5395649.1 UvrD-helicase domain-containing protein [Patescibacteria group bacterium]